MENHGSKDVVGTVLFLMAIFGVLFIGDAGLRGGLDALGNAANIVWRTLLVWGEAFQPFFEMMKGVI